MEKKIEVKIDDFQKKFKDSVNEWFKDNKCTITIKPNASSIEAGDKMNEFLMFVYDYGPLKLTKDDFQKRKRTKNMVPIYDRCNANRSNGQQCTRRKKPTSDHCGTHSKFRPFGEVTIEEKDNTEEIELWIEDVKGIKYYLDKNNNVYESEDVLSNKKNPKAIAKWKKDVKDNYEIIFC
jgi:hypothetical protein